jgi:DEAD/DEAH box helicase domain-containing protein
VKKKRIFEPEPYEETGRLVAAGGEMAVSIIPGDPSARPGTVVPTESAIRPSNGVPDPEFRLVAYTGQDDVFVSTGAPRPALDGKYRYIVFDLETKRLASEVGGWRNIAAMGMSLAVTYTEEEGFRTFFEEDTARLISSLKSASLVVGFNQVRFDYEVLRGYGARGLEDLPNLDILADTYRTLGFRVSLDAFGEAALGKGKSAGGLDAIRWYREGRLDLVEAYCRDDTALTRDLFFFGLDNGRLRYKTRTGKPAWVPVEWDGYRKLRSPTTQAYAGMVP